jgi:hypothetical protein
VVQLVQDLFEPQLVDLMDDDEQRLVVLKLTGARLLERQELVELQVARVGDRQMGLPVEAREPKLAPH